jgi:quinol monooxygenase YgiN
MYGLIGKMKSTPGQRDKLISILLEGSQQMPGCMSYIVAKDGDDQDGIWVTEVWDNQQSHQGSLALPSVRAAIERAMPLIANLQSGVVTEPIGGIGLAGR